MTYYRPFLNGDVPAIVQIWKNQSPNFDLATGITIDLFDSLVLSKPYFDRQGLIMAVEGNDVVGFVHAGFGADATESQLDSQRGVISLLLVHSSCNDQEVANHLLAEGEQYLKDHGASEIYAGGSEELCPFYLGLHGGSDLPGILESDQRRRDLFESNDYHRVDQILRYRIDLDQLRPVVDRELLQLRRTTEIEYIAEPPSRSWWDACTQGCLPQLKALARCTSSKEEMASAIFWDMQTFSATSAKRSMGLCRIEMANDKQRIHTNRYLLLESMRYLREQGINTVHAQAREGEATKDQLFRSAGFQQVDAGIILKK